MVSSIGTPVPHSPAGVPCRGVPAKGSAETQGDEPVMADYKMLINGELRDSGDGDTFATYNPATGEKIADVAKATREDAVAAIQAARTAFDEGTWSRTSGKERAEKLRAIGGVIAANSEELAELEARDGGGTIRKAMFADIPSIADKNAFVTEVSRGLRRRAAPRPRRAFATATAILPRGTAARARAKN